MFSVRVVFKWLMRAFSGHLPPEELLILWDLVSSRIIPNHKTLTNTCHVYPSDPRIRQPRDHPAAGGGDFELSQGQSDAGGQHGKHRGSAGRFVVHQSVATHSVGSIEGIAVCQYQCGIMILVLLEICISLRFFCLL